MCDNPYALSHRWQGKNDMSRLIRFVHRLAIDSKNKYFATA
jgi:hypothetical protein